MTRKEALIKRKEYTYSMVNDASKLIVKNIDSLLASINDCENILCYYPSDNEVNLVPMYERLFLNARKLYFPKSAKDGVMDFYRVGSLFGFTEGLFGIKEPKLCTEKMLFDISAVNGKTVALVPGVLFDKSGNRIGHGMGYYDRYLSCNADIIKIGVTYDEFVLDKIEAKEHDVPMDYIVTENGIIDLTL